MADPGCGGPDGSVREDEPVQADASESVNAANVKDVIRNFGEGMDMLKITRLLRPAVCGRLARMAEVETRFTCRF